MNISKSSWHYRLLSRMRLLRDSYYGPENLCPYCWKVLFAVFVVPIVVVLVAFVATIPLWWWASNNNHLFPLAIIVAIIEVGVLIYYLAVAVGTRHEREIMTGTRERPVNKYKPPSLLRVWLKARHEQVCPIIDFVAEEASHE